MRIQLEGAEELRFDDDSPVRAASAIAPLGDGLLVAQDDTTYAAWIHSGSVRRVRLFPPIDGVDTFEERAGTKRLKPDLEAACPVDVDGEPAVLLLGSGSSPRRMRWALVRLVDGAPDVAVAEPTEVYAAVAAVLAVDPGWLNMEGACVVGGSLRWFHRGLPSAGLPSGSVDLPVDQVVSAALGRIPAASVVVTDPRTYDLGVAAHAGRGIGLAVTDAVALPDGAVLLSAAAEDTPNPRDDGPVVGSALARLGPDGTLEVTALPPVHGQVAKVEGITIVAVGPGWLRLRAVVDVDDPDAASLMLRLLVRR